MMRDEGDAEVKAKNYETFARPSPYYILEMGD